jgi:hypothetical protein
VKSKFPFSTATRGVPAKTLKRQEKKKDEERRRR